jgi:hypothetical protein
MIYDITPIVQAVFALIATLITCLLIPWIRSKTSATQQAELKQWVSIAVAAAEQLFIGQGRGEEKKNWVLNYLQKYNLKVDMDTIETLIESAVYQLK